MNKYDGTDLLCISPLTCCRVSMVVYAFTLHSQTVLNMWVVVDSVIHFGAKTALTKWHLNMCLCQNIAKKVGGVLWKDLFILIFIFRKVH